MEEEWRDIRGFPGYQVSNLGRVRTHNKVTHTDLRGFRYWRDRIMKLKIDKNNNWRVCIWKDGKEYTFLVARLVADAFCGEYRDTDLTVNHIDGNRANNCADNLEWMTIGDNIRDGFNKGLFSAVMKKCKLIDESGNEYIFVSVAEASRFLKRSNTYLSNNMRKGINVYDTYGRKYAAIIYDYYDSASPNTPLYRHK